MGEIVAVESRRLHRGLRRRPLQGHARAARRRQEGRSRRMGQVRQPRHRDAAHMIRSVVPQHSPCRPRACGAHNHRTVVLTGCPLSRHDTEFVIIITVLDPSPCPPRSTRSRNPTSKSPRPPRSGRSWTSRKREARHRAGEPRALRPLQGQGVDGLHQVAQGQAERQADPGHRDHADAGGRGQDHHHGRPHRRAQPHRQEGDAVPARAVARARRSA